MSGPSPRPPRGRGLVGGWDPLNDMLALKDRLNRLFENVLRKGAEFENGELAGWSPAVDLREDSEGFHLTAELPGVPQDRVTVRLDGPTLILEGERPVPQDARGAEHLRVERSYGSFSRTFHLPATIDEKKATASFRLGVLEVFLPRSAEARSSAIKIRIA